MVFRIAWLLVAACLGPWLLAGESRGAAVALEQLQADLRRTVAAIRPSVVCVRAQKRQVMQGGGEMWFESVGSGIVVDARGYVLTNSHVVRSGERVTVTLWDNAQTPLPAVVADEDPDNDLALLKIDAAANYRPAAMGDARSLAVGDWVVSVGSPYGFEHSATFGVVSALGRNLSIGGVAYRDMIQTDATITQGNSGGPLLDLSGVVVAINSAIFSPENAYTGIGFAIPINRAKHFISRTIGAVPTVRAAGRAPVAAPAPVAAQAPDFRPLPFAGPAPAAQTAPQPAPMAQPAPNVQAAPTVQAAPLTQPAPSMTSLPPSPPPAGGPSAAGFAPLPEGVGQGAPGASLAAAVAAPAAAPPNPKEPVDLTKTPPKDATHKQFSDCTVCHVITKKIVANINTPMPHPPIGDCGACHQIINEKPVAGPTPVSWVRALRDIPGLSALGAAPYSTYLLVLAAALAACALGFDPGLLYMPILLLCGLSLPLAAAASLAMLAVGGLPAMVRFRGSSCLDGRLFAAVVPPAALAAGASAFALPYLDPQHLLLGLAGSLVVAAMLYSRNPALESVWGGRPDRGGLAWRTSYAEENYALGLAALVPCVFVAAGIGGLVGASGSWLLVPLVMSVFRVPLPVSAAVSAVAVPTVGAFGLLGRVIVGAPDLAVVAPLCAAAFLGTLAGLPFQSLQTRSRARTFGVVAAAAAAAAILLRVAQVI